MTAGQLADPFDVRYAARATGLLAEFNRTGVLSSADVHVATALGRLGGESDEQVVLAVALAVRAVRYGSVCVDLGQVRTTAAADTEESVDLDLLPWPVPERWYAACAASPLVAGGVNGAPDRPVRLVDELLYLDRYWRQERLVRAELDLRAGCRPTAVDSGRLRPRSTFCSRTPPPTTSGSQRRPASPAPSVSSPADRGPARRRPWPGCWRSCTTFSTTPREWRWPRRRARPPPGCRRRLPRSLRTSVAKA